mmetsp:Transcript_36821/g.81895  ORF Transcript_36821/g.81895 Transcript_36821/m.81895 type:complete len:212 (+) Transcript_36821:243-878(+)
MGTECRSFGVVPNNNVKTLANVLRGLCFKYGRTNVHEIVMKIPLQNGANSTTIKLSRPVPGADAVKQQNPFAEKLPERWLLQHEGLPNRGPNYNDLPAATREVCESYCFADQTPDFWQALGARFEYEMVKSGNEYHCNFMGFEIKVQLLQVNALTQQGNPETMRDLHRKYVLDVSTHVAEGKHGDGARAIGAFGQRLHPLVTLQRAEVPIV